MSDIIKDAKQLAELKVPPLRAEVTVHEDEDPRYVDDCLVQIVEKADEYSIWHEEEYGGYEHGKLHFAHVFAAAPELAQALAEETWEYSVQIKDHTGEWETATNSESHLEEWWESKKHAEWAMAEEQEFGEHCRIVRRRVSPPEVVNE